MREVAIAQLGTSRALEHRMAARQPTDKPAIGAPQLTRPGGSRLTAEFCGRAAVLIAGLVVPGGWGTFRSIGRRNRYDRRGSLSHQDQERCTHHARDVSQINVKERQPVPPRKVGDLLVRLDETQGARHNQMLAKQLEQVQWRIAPP